LSPKIIFFGRKKKKIFPFSFVEGKTLLGERGIGLRQHNIEKKEERELNKHKLETNSISISCFFSATYSKIQWKI